VTVTDEQFRRVRAMRAVGDLRVFGWQVWTRPAAEGGWPAAFCDQGSAVAELGARDVPFLRSGAVFDPC
jgi:hypothetical protein